jgi:hypothetical protein
MYSRTTSESFLASGPKTYVATLIKMTEHSDEEIISLLRDMLRELKLIKVDVEDLRQQLRAVQIHLSD